MEIERAILHYCAYQERCHAEVRNKLYEMGFTSVTVEEQIIELIAKGILNEERFARAYARGKFRMKQWGRVKIKQQLKQKQISEYCIKKSFLEIDEDEYLKVLKQLAGKKWAELKSEKNQFTKRGKAQRYLQQKGYETSLIQDVINELIKK